MIFLYILFTLQLIGAATTWALVPYERWDSRGEKILRWAAILLPLLFWPAFGCFSIYEAFQNRAKKKALAREARLQNLMYHEAAWYEDAQ